MKSLALDLAALTLSGCIVAPYDSYRPPPPHGRTYMDHDGDGVPNGYDRGPGNSYRY